MKWNNDDDERNNDDNEDMEVDYLQFKRDRWEIEKWIDRSPREEGRGAVKRREEKKGEEKRIDENLIRKNRIWHDIIL